MLLSELGTFWPAFASYLTEPSTVLGLRKETKICMDTDNAQGADR